jgi:phage portal protein BeeE
MWPFRKREDRDQLSLEDVLSWGVPNTAAGIVVGADTALRLLAVWSCVSLISNSISSMPIDAYRRSDGQQLRNPPALLTTPAAYMTFAEWVQQLLISVLLVGNSYGLLVLRRGMPSSAAGGRR